MAEFTLLKLEFENASLNAPFSTDGEAEVELEENDEEDDSSGVLPLLLGLVFLVVVAVVVKKVLGGDDGADLDVDTV